MADAATMAETRLHIDNLKALNQAHRQERDAELAARKVALARVAELEAAIQTVYDVLGSGDDEDVDSPGNMAFAVLMSVCPLQMKGDEAK